MGLTPNEGARPGLLKLQICALYPVSGKAV